MAITQKIKLKRFALRDAYLTAPADMGALKLALRLVNTFRDSLYGKARFDWLIVGDDILVSLSAALHLAKMGQTVLVSPDNLGAGSWPSPEWAMELARFANSFDEVVAMKLAPHLNGIDEDTRYLQALSIVIKACAATKAVTILNGAHLQSSKGYIKAKEGNIYFPLRPEYEHKPTLNPLWRLAREGIQSLSFAGEEIEYIEADRLLYSTPLSGFIDSELGAPIGMAINRSSDPSKHTRAETVASAFQISLGVS